MFQRILFVTLAAAGIAILVAWGARAALVYLSYVALVALVAYGAGLASALLRRVSSRRFGPSRPTS